jgi:Flp pilus assembly pilin Flp
VTLQHTSEGRVADLATRPSAFLSQENGMPRSGERGASAVEYSLLVALIAAVVVTAVVALGLTTGSAYEDSCEKISTAMGSDCG